MPMLADTKISSPSGQEQRLAQLLGEAAGDGRGVAVLAGRRHDHELVATEATERLARFEPLEEPGRDLLQHDVADGVALGVVDHLEAVEVEEEHGHPTAVGAHPVERLLDALPQQEPVGQTR